MKHKNYRYTFIYWNTMERNQLMYIYYPLYITFKADILWKFLDLKTFVPLELF